MSSVNKVIIIGNVCKEVEVKFMPNGDAVANLTLATNEKWKDKQTGEQKEKAEFHRVVMFGKLAEIAGQYLKKGSKVYIEGKLQTRKWTNQQGQDQYTTEIVLQGFNGVMQMLDGKSSGQQQSAQNQQGQQQQGGFSQAQQNYAQGQQQNNSSSQQRPMDQAMSNQINTNNQQAGGFQQQQADPNVNHQEPSIDFDDDIPF